VDKWEYKALVCGWIGTLSSLSSMGRVAEVRAGEDAKFSADSPDLVTALNELGEQGWELAGTLGGRDVLIFKRRKS
jgi:hypothetical protein